MYTNTLDGMMCLQLLLAQGDPAHAACCYLSVDDLAGALNSLVRGHCLEMAVALAVALGAEPVCRWALVAALSVKCEVAGAWVCRAI